MFIDSNIYCLATGKPIATISDDELGVVIASLDAVPLANRQAACDMRTLASMRPSMAWLSVTPDSLEVMREAAPRELLAYLLNRMFAPIERPTQGKPFSFDQMNNARRLRIELWQSVESASINSDDFDTLLFLLLKLDSQFNLSKKAIPSALADMWDSWADSNAVPFINRLREWDKSLQKQRVADERRAKAQAEFWSEGNRHTRTAMVAQFNKVKPDSQAVIAKKAKISKLAADLSFLDSLERELTQRKGSEAAAIPATPKPPVRLTRFGTKKAEA